MVCFLSCFGYTKKRKRPKCCTTKIASSNQVHEKYVPLDSDINSQISLYQSSKVHGSKTKETKKENSTSKVKKKVNFNLDVKTYEPLDYDDEIDDIVIFSEGEEETKWEFNEEETRRATTMLGWHHQKDKVTTNYRYQNIQDFYDEEDETILDDSDLDDDIFDDDEAESCDLDYHGYGDDGTIINDHQVSTGKYACSVLNPVENLTQWKAIKAKESQQRRRQKETIISEQENQVPQEKANFSHEIAVNASLANWLLTSN